MFVVAWSWHAICNEGKGSRTGFLSVATYNERTIVIAGVIQRYVEDHPRAADTPEGIRGWWMAGERRGASLEEVETALEYLVETGCLARITLADGTVIYTRAEPSN